MSFQDQQRHFLAHLKQPQTTPLPAGFSPHGGAIYADLLYNKFNDSLSSCFPVLKYILGDSRWQALVADFIVTHACCSPYYRQIPDEFIAYLQHERSVPGDPPFILELGHYEWLELQLTIAPAPETEAITIDSVNWDQTERWLDTRPVFVTVFDVFYYAYPVHEISVQVQPKSRPPQSTAILGFRNYLDEVYLIALQPAAARLLELVHSGDHSLRHAAAQIASELAMDSPQAVYPQIAAILHQLQQQGAIIAMARIE